MITKEENGRTRNVLLRQIDKHSPIPLYHQVEAIVLERIQNGDWKPNDRLPAEHQLIEAFGVSKTTIRQALSNLAASGLIRRDQGRGTFVAEPKVEQGPRELTSFSEEMRRRGLRPSSLVLQKQVIPSSSVVAEKLELCQGDPVFCLKRLRLADGTPMGIQTAYIPASLVPGILKEELGAGSLYEVLRNRYALVPKRAREVHRAVRLASEEAGWLHLPEGSPALAAERIAFADGDRAIELVYSVMHGDRYMLVLELIDGGT